MFDLNQLAVQEWPWILLFCAGLAWATYRYRPAERRNVLLSLLFMLLGVVGLLLGDFAQAQGMQRGGAVLSEIFTILLGLVVLRLLGLALFRLILASFGLEPPRILEDVLVILAYVVWGLARLRYAGLDLSQLVTTSTVITAVLAFAMQDTLGNILSGLALQLDDSVQLGQWVKLGEVSGKVLQIGWRSTLVETRNGETVVVPNAWLMKNSFQMIGKRFNGAGLVWRRWVWFELAWDLPPARVIEVLDSALREVKITGVATNPLPQAVLMEAREGVARYALRYWLNDFAADDGTDSQVRAHAMAALVRHGLVLAAPSQHVWVTKDNDRTAAARQGQEMERRVRALASINLFADFTEAELRQLAERLSFAPFESGAVVSRQGAVAHWLYILTQGEVDIWRDYGQPEAVHLDHLGVGNFFGEMGLMTGAARSATVVADGYVECYRLDRSGFAATLSARPELAERIAEILAERIQTQRAPIKNTPADEFLPKQSELLDRMRRFFGL